MNKITRYKKPSEKSKDEKIWTSLDKFDPIASLRDSKIYQALAGIIVLIILFFGFVNFQSRAIDAKEGKETYIEVAKGDGAKDVAEKLKNSGLIRSKFAFYANEKIFYRGVIQAGQYKLNTTMSQKEILSKFYKGDVDGFKVTIPEGLRTLQIAAKFQELGKVDANAFIEAAIGTEGTLFPDTYVFPYNYSPAKMIGKMKENFNKKTEKIIVGQEDLIIASIVEREAITDEERPKIAAIYKNRLRDNMFLQADPTVRYALDTAKYVSTKSLDFEFWTPITRADINGAISAYNTYKTKGLPPAPICNPGIKSIEASVNYDKNFGDYFYFFHDADRKIHYSKTLDEHNKAIKEFGLPK